MASIPVILAIFTSSASWSEDDSAKSHGQQSRKHSTVSSHQSAGHDRPVGHELWLGASSFGSFYPFENLELERVEQAFGPAVRAGKMPALAAEVLLDDFLQRRNHRIYLLCHRQCTRKITRCEEPPLRARFQKKSIHRFSAPPYMRDECALPLTARSLVHIRHLAFRAGMGIELR